MVKTAGISLVLLVLALTGCGGSGSSSKTTASVPGQSSTGQTSEEQAARQQTGSPSNTIAGSQSSAGSAETFISGFDLCGISRIEDIVRTTYELEPGFDKVSCREQPDPEAPNSTSVVFWPGEDEEGAESYADRVNVEVLEDNREGMSGWENERRLYPTHRSEMEAVQVNGDEAFWISNFALITPANGELDVSIQIYPGEGGVPPTGAKECATEIATLVEEQAFR